MTPHRKVPRTVYIVYPTVRGVHKLVPHQKSVRDGCEKGFSEGEHAEGV